MKLILSIAAIMLLASCQEHLLSNDEMRLILKERNNALGEAFKSGDVQRVVALYTDSAKLCPNGATEIYVGKKAIEEFWTSASAGSKLLKMTTNTMTVDGDRSVIYETGMTTTKTLYKDSVYNSQVKFANVWRKQRSGKFLLDVDIWNALE